MITKDYLFSLAKTVDNNFIGSEYTFTCDKIKDHFLLTTNKCDGASLIRVYPNITGITVMRLGPDTEDWAEIHQATYERISKLPS